MAREFVLEREGLFSDDPVDRGGPTMRGITLRTLVGLGSAGDLDGDGDIDLADVLRVTEQFATTIYRRHYWEASGADQVAAVAPLVAVALFDAAVQHGTRTATRMLQRLVGAQTDGAWGSKSQQALEVALVRWGQRGVVLKLLGERDQLYDDLVARDPAQRRFRDGWRNRLDALADALQVARPVRT